VHSKTVCGRNSLTVSLMECFVLMSLQLFQVMMIYINKKLCLLFLLLGFGGAKMLYEYSGVKFIASLRKIVPLKFN
jgi:hypothetical protein